MTDDNLDPDLVADLEEFVAGGPEPETTEEWTTPVVDEEQANRFMRRLRWVTKERTKIKAVATAEVARINLWADDRVSGLDRAEMSLKRALEGWTRLNFARTRRKSFPTPHGTLKLTAPHSRIEIVDEDAAVTWCRDNERLELTKLTVAKSHITEALKSEALAEGKVDEAWQSERAEQAVEIVTSDGEPIPGVRVVTPLDDTFSVAVSS